MGKRYYKMAKKANGQRFAEAKKIREINEALPRSAFIKEGHVILELPLPLLM